MKKIIILLLCLLSCSLIAISQTRDIIDLADEHYIRERYRYALPLYMEALQSKPDDAELLFKAGVCNLNRFNKEISLKQLEQAFSKDKNIDLHIKYWLGRAYHLNYQFDKAINFYKEYQTKLRKLDSRFEDVDKHIKEAETSIELMKNEQEYIIKNLGPAINSSYSDHSPVLTADGKIMYFTSRRKDNPGEDEELDGEPYEDIFYSVLQDTGWSTPKSLHFNSSGHDASNQLYDNDTKMLLYKFTHEGDIYMSEKTSDSTWSAPKNFKNVNTNRFESSAFMTSDGKTCYFSSNKYKKNDDLDIYYITKSENGTWSKLKELKGEINTKFDEDATFLSKDGNTMYFSSRGHNTMGGFDVFKSTKDSNAYWSKPQNLGYPINTPDDDIYFHLHPDGQRGYLATYRENSFGEKDIYEIIPYKNIIVEGEITEEESNKKMDSLVVVFKSVTHPDKPINDSSAVVQGAYRTKLKSSNLYTIQVKKGNEVIKEDTLQAPIVSTKDQIIKKIIRVPYRGPKKDTIAKDTIPVVIASVDTGKVKNQQSKPNLKKGEMFVLNNVLFETNKSNLSLDAKNDLDSLASLLKAYMNLKIELSGHTDDRGDETLNQKLSEARALAGKIYLVNKGIAKQRIIVIGYGESKPITNNDTEENRRKNRRTEAKIISE